jgi:hypothetical protein
MQEYIYLVPERKLEFFVKIKEGKNFNHRNTTVVFRGLKFEPDTDIGEKDGFRSGTI